MPVRVFLGLDLGGTSTRAVLTDAFREPIARGLAGSGNVFTSPDGARNSVQAAVRDALDGRDPATVVGVGIGVAGYDARVMPDPRPFFETSLASTGVAAPVEVRSDAEIAFGCAAGSPSDGLVLLAGTGAIAARVRAGRQRRTVDGNGWLLGDEGSGAWIGLTAARTVVKCLDHRRAHTPLTEAVATQLNVDLEDVVLAKWRIIDRVRGMSPTDLAGLTPLVFEATEAGDVSGREIVQEGARLLFESLLALDPNRDEPSCSRADSSRTRHPSLKHSTYASPRLG
jgi:glucosamine kinase